MQNCKLSSAENDKSMTMALCTIGKSEKYIRVKISENDEAEGTRR